MESSMRLQNIIILQGRMESSISGRTFKTSLFSATSKHHYSPSVKSLALRDNDHSSNIIMTPLPQYTKLQSYTSVLGTSNLPRSASFTFLRDRAVKALILIYEHQTDRQITTHKLHYDAITVCIQ